MFYWLRHYSLPLLLAISLHAAAALALYQGWNPEREISQVVQPRMVMASLIEIKAKARPNPQKQARQQEQQRAADKAAREKAAKEKAAKEKAAKEKAAAEAAAAEKAAQAKAAQEREEAQAEAARQEQARQEQLKRLAELANTSFEDAIDAESESLQSGTDEQIAATYRAGIYALVIDNWSRPPSARNGMKARLLVELIPTGEVQSVTIEESSGDTPFDRSAEQAVRRARRFEVPQDNAIFEQYFRKFYLLFQPEDLLR